MQCLSYYKEKNILITGAAQGLGLELATLLAPHAKHVIMIDLKMAPTIPGANCTFYQIDLRESAKAFMQFQEIENKHNVQILFACAGQTTIGKISMENYQTNRQVFESNYFSATDAITFFCDHMKKRKEGHLIAISSIGYGRGLPELSAYFSAKSALNVFMESLNLELRGTAVSTTVINPGFMKSSMATSEKIKHSFVTELDQAAKLILNACAKKKSEYSFPFPMKILSFINRILPHSMYRTLLKFTLK